jgi:hypothetical protein
MFVPEHVAAATAALSAGRRERGVMAEAFPNDNAGHLQPTAEGVQ